MHSSFVKVNNVSLHVVQNGPADGPLVILLHGFPEFWYSWKKYIEPLASAGFRVLVPDQRGYNLSEKPKGIGPYHLDTLARDVLELTHAFGREKVHLAGHDWGGAVAWWFALHHPQHLEKLVILNMPHPAMMLHSLKRSLSQLRRSTYIFFFQIPALPEAILRANDWRIPAEILLHSSLPGTFTPEDLEQYRQAWWQKGACTAMLNWYRAAARKKLTLPKDLNVHSPTLMLWGIHDPALGQEMAQPSIDLCDHGRLIYFDNSTHWVHHENAQLISALLIDFFREGS